MSGNIDPRDPRLACYFPEAVPDTSRAVDSAWESSENPSRLHGSLCESSTTSVLPTLETVPR